MNSYSHHNISLKFRYVSFRNFMPMISYFPAQEMPKTCLYFQHFLSMFLKPYKHWGFKGIFTSNRGRLHPIIQKSFL